jgi:hypothetical protein
VSVNASTATIATFDFMIFPPIPTPKKIDYSVFTTTSFGNNSSKWLKARSR